MQFRGFSITAIKCDPYLNVDAGTMNPYIHGEVFVLDDGYEADMDLGTYERFLGGEFTGINNITSGQVWSFITKNASSIANFTWNPINPKKYETITLTDTSVERGRNIKKWQWDFGDGNNGSGQSITHSYSSGGQYVVTLTITDNWQDYYGQNDSISKDI